MKPTTFLAVVAALAGAALLRRRIAAQADAQLWREVTREPDLR